MNWLIASPLGMRQKRVKCSIKTCDAIVGDGRETRSRPRAQSEPSRDRWFLRRIKFCHSGGLRQRKLSRSVWLRVYFSHHSFELKLTIRRAVIVSLIVKGRQSMSRSISINETNKCLDVNDGKTLRIMMYIYANTLLYQNRHFHIQRIL